MMVAYLHTVEHRRVEIWHIPTQSLAFLSLQIEETLYPPVACGYNEVGESNSFSSGANTCAYLPVYLVFLCVCVYVCVGRRNPLQAVIHGRLFHTMPLYRSPFILAAGCLRAAGALWRILKEGSRPAAILYEETQLGPWLYCLKGAVQPTVESRSSRKTRLNKERVEGGCSFVADLLSFCSQSSERKKGSGARK